MNTSEGGEKCTWCDNTLPCVYSTYLYVGGHLFRLLHKTTPGPDGSGPFCRDCLDDYKSYDDLSFVNYDEAITWFEEWVR